MVLRRVLVPLAGAMGGALANPCWAALAAGPAGRPRFRATSPDERPDRRCGQAAPRDDVGPALLWLEACPETSAPGVHLRGTLTRLSAAGVVPAVVLADQEIAQPGGGRNRRGRRLARLLVAGTCAAPRGGGVLLARWHPLLAPAMWWWKHRGNEVVVLVQGNLADLHAAHPWTSRWELLTRLSRWSLVHADRIAAPAHGIRTWVADWTGRPVDGIAYLPNGVDVHRPPAEGHPPDLVAGARPYAVFVGALATWQGIETIVAAKRDPAWPSGMSLVVLGDGPQSSLVDHLDDPSVLVLGTRPRVEVAQWLGAAVVSLAARTDSPASQTGVAPFKVIESATAGTPIVATDVPGQGDLVREIGGGILVPPSDPAALARAVRTIYEDPALRARLSRHGLAGVTRYDWAHDAALLAGLVDPSPGQPTDLP